MKSAGVGGRARAAAGLVAVCAGAAWGQVFEWGVQFGSPAFDTARRIVPDGAGGVYLAGWTEGSLAGPNLGNDDAYLARYGPNGSVLWQRQVGTDWYEYGYAVAGDGEGGVYFAGRTSGSLGGPNLGGSDSFLARYGADGERRWTRQFGTPESDAEESLASDGAGGVYIVGLTAGSLGSPNAGLYDAYLARYDGEGRQLWVRQFGTPASDGAGGGVAPDGTGGAFVVGSTSGSLGGPNAGRVDAYIARYDGDGTRRWLIQFGTSLHDWAWGCAPDGNGGVYVVGETYGDLAGPPGGTLADAFIARFDADGNRLWVRQFGGGPNQNDTATAAAPDGRGGVLVAGHTTGNIAAPNAGFWDVFFARYDADGERIWAGQFGTSGPGPFGGDDRGSGVAPDGAGGVFVSGNTSESLWGPHSGDKDAYVARYSIACYADCDTETGPRSLDIFDFLCFQNRFVVGLPYACDCDTSTGQGVCDIFDFLCFQDAFAGGCP